MTQFNLPLERWREIIAYHPFHFWGLADNSVVPVTSNCNQVVKEYAWQGANEVGRHEIRQAIETAESRLREWLGYSVGRRWVIETLQYPQPKSYGKSYLYDAGARGRWMNIRASEGWVRNCGVKAYETLTVDSVTFTSKEGLIDEFVITATSPTTITDTSQIELYVAESQRFGTDTSLNNDDWKIRPFNVSVSGTTVTITGKAWLIVKPSLYDVYVWSNIDPTYPPSATNYLTQASDFELYRVYTNPDGTTFDTAQAVLIWETQPYPAFCTSSNATFSPNSSDPAAYGYVLARSQIRDAQNGEITVGAAVYDSDSGEWKQVDWGLYRQPDRVILRYECGVDLENTINNSLRPGDWDIIVARLSAAELSARICACDTSNRELYRWQFDRALSSGGENYALDPNILRNPFGTREGAIYAWRNVENLALTRAYLPG